MHERAIVIDILARFSAFVFSGKKTFLCNTPEFLSNCFNGRPTLHFASVSPRLFFEFFEFKSRYFPMPTVSLCISSERKMRSVRPAAASCIISNYLKFLKHFFLIFNWENERWAFFYFHNFTWCHFECGLKSLHHS